LVVFCVLSSALIACAPGAEDIPDCEGTFQLAIDPAAGSAFPSREEAAIAALESAFDIDVSRVALVHEGGRHFRVVVADLRVLERPPLVSIERNEDGFLSDGLSC
jgi:hypothetical protein